MGLKIHTITLTRKDTGEGVTDVFGSQEEAVNHFLKLAAINRIPWQKAVSKLDTDLMEFIRGENRNSIITLRVYDIKAKNRWKPK